MGAVVQRRWVRAGLAGGMAAIISALTMQASSAQEAPPGVPLLSMVERTAPGDLGIPANLNPYDPDELRADALIAGPDGKERVLPCFWYVPCEQYFEMATGDDGRTQARWERFREKGPGEWRFRYCPSQPGDYRYSYAVTVRGRSTTQPGGTFSVAAKPANALVPLGVPKGSRYLRHRDGQPFVAVGLNLGWPDEGGSESYAKWLAGLRQAGGNCARLWLVHYYGGTASEWTPTKENSGYAGVGRYSQEAGARMDRILEAAQQNRVYLILSFFSFGDTNWDWQHSPYYKGAGGWLVNPREFFTDVRARKGARDVLRYGIARYGWAASVMAWELWNEVESSQGYDDQAVYAWHREMAAYVKGVDTHEHLLTTSYRFTPPITPCHAYSLDTVDFIQIHAYWPRVLEQFCGDMRALWRFNKPVLIAEYGLHVSPNYFDADPAGMHLHDGAWAGVFSMSAGAGMTWWWERYVFPRDLTYHLAGLSRFVAGEDLEGAVACSTAGQASRAVCFSFAMRTQSGTLAWVGTKREPMMTSPQPNGEVKSYTCARNAGPLRLLIGGDYTGTHMVVFYDTFDGLPIGVTAVTGTEKSITIPVPSFRHDVALKCFPQNDAGPATVVMAKETPLHDRFDKEQEKAGL